MADVKRLGNIYDNKKYTGKNFAGNVWDSNCLSPALSTMEGGGREPMIVEDFYESREPRVYKDCAPTLRAEREGLKVVEEAKVLGGLTTELKSNNGTQYYQQDRVYGSDGLAMCEPANLPGGSYKYLVKEQIPADHIEVAQATKDGSIECKVGGCYNSNYPDSKTRRGRVVEDGDVTPTLTVADIEKINYVETKYRIRKLTPKECWRLMGYTDEDFDKASASGVSNSQLYKQAGNAIVKQVLMSIFAQMIPQSARASS